MIPRIILCMGAERVETVASIDHAREKPDKYDRIVMKDADDARRANKTHRLQTCVGFPWVKECLITGRLLPPD